MTNQTANPEVMSVEFPDRFTWFDLENMVSQNQLPLSLRATVEELEGKVTIQVFELRREQIQIGSEAIVKIGHYALKLIFRGLDDWVLSFDV